ncbi:MAG: M28 family metallopeptidase [Dehalococcoidia bacterium]
MTAVVAFACGGGASTPVPTSGAPTGVSTESNGLGPPAPELSRIEEHIHVLSDEIGVRTAGSPEEQEVIEYARGLFERWGYQVEIQPFEISSDLLRAASVSAAGDNIKALTFRGAASGTVTAPLVDVGAGGEGEFPSDARGAVVLIQRKDVRFIDMATRAKAAGAQAVIVANRDPELFQGGFSEGNDLPFLAIDKRDGEALRDRLAAGAVEVTIKVEAPRKLTAHNVIARPEDGKCRTVSGGHYDSVPVSPGANDNASGAATVLELARATAAEHRSGDCFVLFSAEEIGLVGSGQFVLHLTEQERAGVVAVFNYDVVAGTEPVGLIGSRTLAAQADALGNELGIEARADSLPEGLSSDHVSFLDAGIPALMLTTHGFARIHTAQDTVVNLEPDHLQDIATLGFAMLEKVGG